MHAVQSYLEFVMYGKSMVDMEEKRKEDCHPGSYGKLWLADGTEYSLKLGPNMIGRVSGIFKNDVGISTEDLYLGRQHFIVEVTLNKFGFCDYIISDNKSKNGTTIIFAANNMKKMLKPTDKVYLKNGDLISAGKTIFKLKALNQQVTEVMESAGDLGGKTQIGNR